MRKVFAFMAIAVIVVAGSSVAAPVDDLLQRGREAFRGAQYAQAVGDLKTAADTLYAQIQTLPEASAERRTLIDRLETALVYLTVANARIGHDVDATEAIVRLAVTERIEPHFALLPLDAEVAEFAELASRLAPGQLPVNNSLAGTAVVITNPTVASPNVVSADDVVDDPSRPLPVVRRKAPATPTPAPTAPPPVTSAVTTPATAETNPAAALTPATTTTATTPATTAAATSPCSSAVCEQQLAAERRAADERVAAVQREAEAQIAAARAAAQRDADARVAAIERAAASGAATTAAAEPIAEPAITPVPVPLPLPLPTAATAETTVPEPLPQPAIVDQPVVTEPRVSRVTDAAASDMLRRAQAAAASGDLATAADVYARLLATPGLSREALADVATGFYQVGDFERARAAFAAVGALRRGEEDLRYYKAVSLFETGDYHDARIELACALPYIELTQDVEHYRDMIEEMAQASGQRRLSLE